MSHFPVFPELVEQGGARSGTIITADAICGNLGAVSLCYLVKVTELPDAVRACSVGESLGWGVF
jgi:hypothetical protein